MSVVCNGWQCPCALSFPGTGSLGMIMLDYCTPEKVLCGIAEMFSVILRMLSFAVAVKGCMCTLTPHDACLLHWLEIQTVMSAYQLLA